MSAVAASSKRWKTGGVRPSSTVNCSRAHPHVGARQKDRLLSRGSTGGALRRCPGTAMADAGAPPGHRAHRISLTSTLGDDEGPSRVHEGPCRN
jgi:hypothetical protein